MGHKSRKSDLAAVNLFLTYAVSWIAHSLFNLLTNLFSMEETWN